MSNSHSKAAYQLGQESAKSFLKAGENHISSGRSNPGTDEERFKNFFNNLSLGKQKTLRKYFLKQTELSPRIRKKLLGKYANLTHESKLDLSTTARFLESEDGEENKLDVIHRTLRTNIRTIINRRPPILRLTSPVYNEVGLYLNRLSVPDDEDNNGDDEITLEIIQIDTMGKLSRVSKNLGSVRKFRNQRDIVRNVKLSSVRIDEGGNIFPKAAHFIVTGVERDNGRGNQIWSGLMDSLVEYAQKKVDEELIAQGIVAGGSAVGVPIPSEVAFIVASFTEGFFDSLIGKIGELLKDKDDIMGLCRLSYEIDKFDYSSQPNDDISRSPIITFKKGGFFQSEGQWLLDFYIKKEGRGSRPVATPPITSARLEWWEGKYFQGRKHTKYLNPMQNGKCISLVHNDAMKSLKFYANSGAILKIYDNGDCQNSDDIGIVTIPDGTNMVAVSRIGRRGVQDAIPTGAYRLVYRNGIVGKVSSIKHYRVE